MSERLRQTQASLRASDSPTTTLSNPRPRHALFLSTPSQKPFENPDWFRNNTLFPTLLLTHSSSEFLGQRRHVGLRLPRNLALCTAGNRLSPQM